ncbi:hypothetical protein MMC34_003672 [Xylographa carneopallida]|nr:hypothetical protein [Xylographa carneopallida]
MKPPPWRYVAAAVALFGLIVLFLASQHSDSSEPGNVVPSTTNSHARTDILDDIYNTTLGFEKILAVSLPERTDRRDGLILATAVSDIEFDFVDGVHGDTVMDKTLPPGNHGHLPNSSIGSWRAHLNAVAEVVHKNYTSALIMEDDADWDVRLKPLLRDFALSYNALARIPNATTLDYDSLPLVQPPSTSPYGDDWDLLWLGHCGMHLPFHGLAFHHNDTSVPEAKHLRSWDINEISPLVTYPPHTRVVMRQAEMPVCSLVYAISQRGARKLLYSLSLQKLDSPYDVMLRAWCEGADGKEAQLCPGVLPQLFDHYRRAGSKTVDSDISEPNEEVREKEETLNIRWSVRLNMEKLLRGERDYDNQYPDTL